MDNIDRLFDSISLGDEGIVDQFISLGSSFNLILSAVFGLLILIVYLKTNKTAKKEKIFIISIPIISILMTMLMRMRGGSAIIFFGIFGVLSIIRFRSSTSQSDISFILFSVIIGVLIGIGNYVLVIIGFVIITVIIVVINVIFNITLNHYISVILNSSISLMQFQSIVKSFLDSNQIKYRLVKINTKNKKGSDVIDSGCFYQLNYDIMYTSHDDLFKKCELINEYMNKNNIVVEIKKDFIEG